ncbi:NAD(P)-dependent oxidoreductase [Mycolicibacterium sp. P9-64]|uniref:NAD-dependent epimerase/dehydratase family protein n=1 Tax=Mycolicibacterium sp. P9-64 TaxID=2024612 RepID=UPI0011F05152|nr:NAD(P)-dependent oxidoreductase [Mycolicibacterium sp. P9-64]KAA0075519.1 NAD(P)-dependent oxidoreductase [Mycolicibacterium sp. P9-64]
MRILIAGASGVVGKRVVQRLHDDGHTVTGLSRRPEQAATIEAAGAHALVADVYDTDSLRSAFDTAKPEVVIHQLTDLSGGDRTANAKIRTVGTRNLVDAARHAGVGRIVAQSIAWAYAPGDSPAGEDTPLDLGGAPDRLATVAGVAALEDAVRDLPEWVVLRYGMLYGPDTWYYPGGLMAQMAQSRSLPATADVVSFLHVDDAAAAAVAALAWPSGPVNVCDDDPAPGYDWVPSFCEHVGAPRPERVAQDRAGWARGADNAYARSQLGWAPQRPTWRYGDA